ncbi:GntR family transcriptional regulator [Rhodococcus sp. NPDC079359]
MNRGDSVLLMEQTHAALLRLAAELESRSVARLPPERELAERLGTSRTTLRKALDLLERDGVIRRTKGRAGGAFLTSVTPGSSSPESAQSLCQSRRLLRSLNTVKGVPQMLHEQGFRDGTKVISARIAEPSPEAAQVLGDGPVVSLLRLRFADGDTLSLEQMYLSDSICGRVLETPLNSVYEALRTRLGVSVCMADESIELATISAPAGTLLRQPEGTPILKLERIGYDQSERPVEYSVDLFRADRTRLSVRTSSLVSASVTETST